MSNESVKKLLEKENNRPVDVIEIFAHQIKNNLDDFQIEYIMDQINRKDSLALAVLKHLSFLEGQNIEFELELVRVNSS